MRSELIFGALTHISNRYHTRLQDTMNDVLLRFRESSPAAAALSSRQEPISIPHPQRRAA
jgi:hypothetical protein